MLIKNTVGIFLSFLILLVQGSPLIEKLKPEFLPQLVAPRPANNGSKIVGGVDTTISDHPHQVSLLYFHQHICGGSLVSSRWVISAAHCTQLFRPTPSIFKFSVRLGTSLRNQGGIIMAVSKIVDHPLYDLIPFDYDITLIQLSREVDASNPLISPIALPALGQTSPLPGSTAVVTGWGTLASGGPAADILQEVYLPIVSQSTCQTLYDNLGVFNPPIQITDSMICAGFLEGGYDSCQGDSGGPLVVNNQLIGVVSWGYLCAYPGAPGVYASVPRSRQWIRDTANL